MSEPPTFDPLIRLLVTYVQLPLFSLAALFVLAIGLWDRHHWWWWCVFGGYVALVVQRLVSIYALNHPGPWQLVSHGILPIIVGALLAAGCFGYLRELWRTTEDD